MKLTRKSIYALNDCFEATEGTVLVSIRRHRHKVIVDCATGDTVTQAELSLAQLARILRYAETVVPKQEQQWGTPPIISDRGALRRVNK